jgi:cytochrome o ubiquinol oxidase subunit I
MLGFMGATRRLDHYSEATGWQPLFLIALGGVFIIFCGMGFQALQLYVSIRNHRKNRDLTGDPWNGRTLEWSTTSPPPIYNFAIIPTVDQRDAFWAAKQGKAPKPENDYETIHIPKNGPMGLVIGFLSLIFGFAFTWQIYWLVILSFLAMLACVVVRLSSEDEFEFLSPDEVKKMEQQSRELSTGHMPT